MVAARLIDKAVEYIAAKEAFSPIIYTDQAGIKTWGYGSLAADFPAEPFPTTEERARAVLRLRVERDFTIMDNLVTVPLEENQGIALTSLLYNIGVTAFTTSTLLKLLNQGDYDGAAAQFLVWNKITKNGRKVVSKGLQNRREAERALFLTPSMPLIDASWVYSKGRKAINWAWGGGSGIVGTKLAKDYIQPELPPEPTTAEVKTVIAEQKEVGATVDYLNYAQWGFIVILALALVYVVRFKKQDIMKGKTV